MKKMSPEKRCLIALSIFSAVLLVVFIPISAVFSFWGLTIGWAIGFIVAFTNMFLLFKSGMATSESAMNSGKGMGFAAAFYIMRFALFAIAFVITALLDYYCKIVVFKYSLFTCAAALLPSTLIITILYHSADEEVVKKVDTTNNKQ